MKYVRSFSEGLLLARGCLRNSIGSYCRLFAYCTKKLCSKFCCLRYVRKSILQATWLQYSYKLFDSLVFVLFSLFWISYMISLLFGVFGSLSYWHFVAVQAFLSARSGAGDPRHHSGGFLLRIQHPPALHRNEQ